MSLSVALPFLNTVMEEIRAFPFIELNRSLTTPQVSPTEKPWQMSNPVTVIDFFWEKITSGKRKN
jgi:hypothetical protein